MLKKKVLVHVISNSVPPWKPKKLIPYSQTTPSFLPPSPLALNVSKGHPGNCRSTRHRFSCLFFWCIRKGRLVTASYQSHTKPLTPTTLFKSEVTFCLCFKIWKEVRRERSSRKEKVGNGRRKKKGEIEGNEREMLLFCLNILDERSRKRKKRRKEK